jgi:hypothetical protein
VIYKHWDAMSKIKLYDYGDTRGLNIDNVANSPVYPFDGDWSTLRPGETAWGINVSYLIRRFESCTFLSLGAGGGTDVLQALAEGAKEVHAVEVNPQINAMMLRDDDRGYLLPPPPRSDSAAAAPGDSTGSRKDSAAARPARVISVAEYTGHLYRDPRVKVVTEDGRAYVRRFRGKFDVIFSLSSNTWAALSSGAFALAESYLFTTEAFQDYWRALTPGGFLVMEHQTYVSRLVSEAMAALKEMKVDDPYSHLAVYELPKMRRRVLLLSKQALTAEIREHALGPLTAENYPDIHLQYPPPDEAMRRTILVKILERGWRNMADSAAVDISPVRDDRPFIAQAGLWRNLTGEKMKKAVAYADMYGFPVSKLILLVLLATVLVIILPLNSLPYLRGGTHLRAAPWLYFFAIGVAFMAVEVVLMQRFALLIGPPLYSVSTILLTLLVSSGTGSRFSERCGTAAAFTGILGGLLLHVFVLRHLIPWAGGLGLPLRMSLTALCVFPLGFFMGMPFPLGTARVGELIDWGFAVNGAASVLGSIAVLMLALAWGLTAALMLALLMYGLAFLLSRFSSAW